MSKELRCMLYGVLKDIWALFVIAGGLIILTLLSQRWGEATIIEIYNAMFFLFPILLGVLVLPGIMTYMLVNLQFGADRKTMYYAVEIVLNFILLTSWVVSIGMNQFSMIMYQGRESCNWSISIQQWVAILLVGVLACKFTQHIGYTNVDKDKMKNIVVKATTIGVLCCVMCIGFFVGIRLDVSRIALLERMVNFLNQVVVSMGIIGVMVVAIGVLIRKNYFLFMKLEV